MKHVFALMLMVVCFSMQPAKSEESMESVAIKLVAMSSFVSSTCAGMEPNWLLLRVLLEKFGVDLIKLQQDKAKMIQGELIIAVFKNNSKQACTLAWEKYGVNGSDIAGIIEKK